MNTRNIRLFLMLLCAPTLAAASPPQNNVERLQRVGTAMTTLLAAKIGNEVNFQNTLADNFCLSIYNAETKKFVCEIPSMENVNGLTKNCKINEFVAIDFTQFVSVSMTCIDKSPWPNLLFSIINGRVTRIVNAPPPLVVTPAPSRGMR